MLKYIILFIIFIILNYLTYTQILKNKLLKNGRDADIFYFYDNIRINNKFELFLNLFFVFLNIIFSFFIFFFLRIYYLGTMVDISTITFNFINLIDVLVVLLLFITYFNFMKICGFFPIIRIYFFYVKKIYPYIYNYIIINRFFVNKNIFTKIFLFCEFMVDEKKRYSMINFMEAFDKDNFFYKVQKYVYKEYKNNMKILKILKMFYIIFRFLSKWHIFWGYLPSLLLIYTFLYDIKNNYFFYSYYSLLFFFFLTSIYSKFLKFLSGLQVVSDKEPLWEFLYEGPYFKNINFVILERDILEKKDRLTKEEEIHLQNLEIFCLKSAKIYDLTNFYIDYILNCLTNPELRILGGDILDNPNFIWPIRRFILLLFSSFSFIYLNFFVNFLEKQSYFYIFYFISFFLIILSWISIDWKKNEILFLHIIFYFFSVGLSLFSLYVFFINCIPVYYTDTLLNYPFTIINYLSDEKKILFLYHYFDYIISPFIINMADIDHLRFLLREIYFESYSKEINQFSLKDLQIFINIFIENEIFNRFFDEKLIFSFLQSLKNENPPSEPKPYAISII